jgi:hypothetical protein
VKENSVWFFSQRFEEVSSLLNATPKRGPKRAEAEEGVEGNREALLKRWGKRLRW